ncbi:MAG: carbohydrate-binding protein [Bacteroidetes bacterium]|nr:carbohydrate-binding protein [Bacteroidota bacterium]
MKRLLLLAFLVPAVCFGQGDQTIINVPIDNSGTTEKAILHLPDDYGKTTTKYPIMVFLHGIGEGGTNPASIYGNSNAGGPAYWISQGKFPSSFVNPADKKTYKYIIISPQSTQGWSTTAPQLDVILTWLIKNYRVDEARLYLTGLSAGGEGVVEYCGQILSSGSKYVPTHKIAALIPMSAVMNAVYEPNYASTMYANKVKFWGFGSPSDTHGANTLGLVYYLNILSSGYAIQTSYSGGHCCWGQFYDPSFKQSGMSIYEWALQYTQGTSAPPSDPDSGPTAPTNPTTYTIPGKVEAEGYASMLGVQTETTSDAGAGQDVGWIDNGDWMKYNVNCTAAGQYTVSFRVASLNTGAAFQVLNAAGSVLATVTVPNTGAYQTWQTVTANVTLPAGASTLTIKSTTGYNWNFNWMQFSPVVTGPSNPTGTVIAIPGKGEAENYAAMGGVQTETTADAGGGLDVGWIDNGDYMDYSVNVATAGAYTASFRVASINTGATFQVTQSNGTVLGTVTVPNTGSYQVWQTVTANLTLPAGTNTLRIKSTSTLNWNLNWFQFVQASTPPTSGTGAAIPGKIEAESYTQWSGVGTETTLDAGGGKDVAGIDKGDWMEYTVSVASSGTYTASFRVATPLSGASIQILSDGTQVGLFKPGSTGDWQTWQTFTTTVTLSAGSHKLRIVSAADAQFNFNWMQFTLGTVSASTRVGAQSSSAALFGTDAATDAGSSAAALTLFPNPVRDQLTLQVNNSETGSMSVQIIDASGAVRGVYNYSKTSTYFQANLSAANLPAGVYFLRIQVGKWSDVRKIVKQ